MGALSTDTIRLVAGAKTLSLKIANGSQLYVGSFASVLAGYAQPFAGAAGEMLVGRTLPSPDPSLPTTSPFQLKGNTSPAAGIPVPEATICTEGEVLKNVAVTGVSAQTSVGAIVYLNSTDNDLTLTRPARGVPFGCVTRWYSSTSCDVMRFGFETLCAAMLSGSSDTNLLAAFQFGDIASGDITIMAGAYGGTISKVSATVVKAFTTGASGSVTIQPKIGTTLTTGGVITVNTTGGTGGTAGDVCAGTPITANNAFSEGSALKLTLTLTSTFTAGSMLVYGTFNRALSL
jgi:hypothetical protein